MIGIIGGMGPEATVDVFSKIVAATPSRKDQDHLRIIIDNNPKVPSRFKFIMGEGENPLPCLLDTARKLEQYGADVLLIACNAAHYFYDDIRKNVRCQLLHIAEEVRLHVESMEKKTHVLGLMASGSTVKAGIYQRTFARSRIRLVLPSSQAQETLSKVIYDFKQKQRMDELGLVLMDVVEPLVRKGAQAIVLGCTELPLILRNFEGPIPFIDANQVLAAAAVRAAMAAGGS
jgi:aspartate racemase